MRSIKSKELSGNWNAFKANERMRMLDMNVREPEDSRPSTRLRRTYVPSKSVIRPLTTKIAMDCVSYPMRHMRVDEDENYVEPIPDSPLDYCLHRSANIDQTGRAFMQDLIESMFDEGRVAAVPVDTILDPTISEAWLPETMRVAQILGYFPTKVRLRLYNQASGQLEDIIMPKTAVAIIENPMYTIMNEFNSTMTRLLEKLSILDVIDKQSGSGKLDLILQLPYVVKSERKQELAMNRKKALEDQLADSKYGIGYIDGTERITQLNRAVDNNLMTQVEYLQNELRSQLGITPSVFDGTATEEEMVNYYNRTIATILRAISDEFTRKFLSQTAVTQMQRVQWLNDPFKLVSPEKMSEIADKFTRNEILTPNEVRPIVGYRPSKDPAADELRNRNLNQKTEEDITVKEKEDVSEGS